MQAVIRDTYGSADVLRVEDAPTPEPARDEVRLRVRAAGVGPDVWHMLTGRPYLARLGFGLRAPKSRFVGSDVAGTVEAVGTDVTELRVGDDVFGVCRGALAEYACARPDTLAARPANLTFVQAAAVPVSACAALRGLRDEGRIESGQRVVIVGASGGVGTFAVQLARAFGAEVTGVCRTDAMDLVRSLGADHVIDYTSEDFTTGSRRYDLILDTAGRRPVSRLRRALAPRGTLVIVGGEGGGRWLGGFQRQVLGAALISPLVRQRIRSLISHERREDLRFLAELIEAGSLTPVVSATYPLADVADALRDADEGHGRGKRVVTI